MPSLFFHFRLNVAAWRRSGQDSQLKGPWVLIPAHNENASGFC
jgi:hypothetical protein